LSGGAVAICITVTNNRLDGGVPVPAVAHQPTPELWRLAGVRQNCLLFAIRLIPCEGAGMIKSWRLLIAAAVNVIASVGIATAQTVLVKHAPAGESIEVVLNSTKVATGTADTAGDASFSLDLNKSLNKTEIDATVFVDACDKLHRVIVVERAKLPDPQPAGCTRRDVQGLFWVRPINTLVVDVGSTPPSLLLTKGAYNPDSPHTWMQSPTGLVVFGGGGIAHFRDAVAVFCGSVSPCTGDSTRVGYTAGATFWITPWLGGEGSYLKPSKVTADGSGDTFRFTSSLDVKVATIAGKVGIPAGPVRIYGMVGAAYHWATSSTTETIDTASQTFQFKTEGWGWLFGGGGEVWVASRVALYGEIGFAGISGSDKAGSEARIDDQIRYILGGGRVRIGRSR
jgi:hypothetical protein